MTNLSSNDEGLEPRRISPDQEVEGHIRLIDDGKEHGNSFIRPDDTGGHSRFGLFLDAEQPVKDAAPRRTAPSQDDDVEGHRRF